MRRLMILQILLAACSSGGHGASEPSAALQVTFGAGAPIGLEGDIVSNTTNSRLMMQCSDSHVTVFVSLPTPLQVGQITLSQDAQSASVWAKQDSMPPLIATSGVLTIDTVGKLLNFEFTDISKPVDSTGASLLITGSMTGITPPP